MIILDTNVVSEVMRPRPDPRVQSWLNDQVAETLFLSSVTLAELLFGIGALPTGSRRDRLKRALDALLKLFPDRILPFKETAAHHYADMAVAARASGRPLPITNGYLAAIAASQSFAVATRNIKHFRDTGVAIINPWD